MTDKMVSDPTFVLTKDGRVIEDHLFSIGYYL